MSDKFYVYCHDCKKLVAVCHDLDMASIVSSAYFKATKHNHTLGTEKYFKGAYPDIVLEPKKAVIMLVSGCTSIVEKPDALAVEIHDYDIEGDWVKENPDCLTDIEGDRYQVISYPATEIKFSANGASCFTDEEISSENEKVTIGWQPHEDNFPIAGLMTFEVYKDLEMGKGCHPEVKNWIEIFEGMIEEYTLIPSDEEDKALKNITILSHNISYFLDENELFTIEVGDCEYEHIHYMIGEGYIEGELNKTNPTDENKTIVGWWKIVK